MPWSLSSSLCSQIVTTFCLCHNVVIVIKSTPFFLRPHHCSHIWWKRHLASLSRRLQSNDPSLTHSLNFPLILQRQDIITIFFSTTFRIIWKNPFAKPFDLYYAGLPGHQRWHGNEWQRLSGVKESSQSPKPTQKQWWGTFVIISKIQRKQQQWFPVNSTGMDTWTPKNLRVRGCIKFT